MSRVTHLIQESVPQPIWYMKKIQEVPKREDHLELCLSRQGARKRHAPPHEEIEIPSDSIWGGSPSL